MRFNPKRLSGLVIWSDASREWSITKDGSNLVSQWKDLSGGNRHFVQATGAAQPLYVPNVLNGRPVLRFDGSNDRMFSGALGFSGDQLLTIAIVFKQNSGNGIAQFGSTSTEPALYSYKWTCIGKGVAGGVITAWNIALYVKTATGYFNPNNIIRRNGVQPTLTYDSAAATFIPSYSAASTMQLGMSIGEYGNLDVAEIVIYNRALSAAERNKVERYLNQKYRVY